MTGHVDDGDASESIRGEQSGLLGERVAIETVVDHDHMRGYLVITGVSIAVDHIIPNEAVDHVGVGGHHEPAQVGRCRRRAFPPFIELLVKRVGVRQQADPIPSARMFDGSQHEHTQMFRRMPYGRLADQRAGERLRMLDVAQELHTFEGTHIYGVGHVAQGLMRQHESMRRRGRNGIKLRQGRQFGRFEFEAERHLLGAAAQDHEVLVCGDAFPATFRFFRERRQGLRRWRVPERRVTLFAACGAYGFSQSGQIGEVFPA